MTQNSTDGDDTFSSKKYLLLSLMALTWALPAKMVIDLNTREWMDQANVLLAELHGHMTARSTSLVALVSMTTAVAKTGFYESDALFDRGQEGTVLSLLQFHHKYVAHTRNVRDCSLRRPDAPVPQWAKNQKTLEDFL
jgi:hypothetical protein